ncbi:MAG: glycosyl transferase, partial [Bryobacteraceae bacterium]
SRAEGKFLDSMLEEMGTDPASLQPYFLASLSEQLHGEDAVFAATRQWVEQRITEPLADVVRQGHQREASSRVGVANSITSLRQLTQIDFQVIFEKTSLVHMALREDPSGLYPKQDFATRDRCRRRVERLSRYGKTGEMEVAHYVVERAKRGEVPIERHAEYYLLSDGRSEIEAWAGYAAPMGARFSRTVRRHATFFYLCTIAALTGFTLAIALAGAWASGARVSVGNVLLILLSLFPLSELAIQIVNAMVIGFLPPDELPGMSFEDGIPEEHATLVVVPMMLSTPAVLRQELEKLEVRHLANPEVNLSFALFSDFVDADTQNAPGDEKLLAAARSGIDELNQRNPGAHFLLFHRQREWSESEQRWIGRERKRGKIEDLNAFLCGEKLPILQAGTLQHPIAFVITLDADTLLPSGTGRRLVETIAHPLNRVELTADGRHRRRGFTIIQPRVSVSLPGATISRFTRLFADARGTDTYARVVSDVYQDLFGEGIFHGKAIYDVRAFHAILDGRFPAETLLSHDLIEGAHVGVALASPVELFENLPADYGSFCRREHRWIRGDWQIASWIFSRVPAPEGARAINPLSIINRWKIADNLRRSLVPIASILLLLGAWFWSESPAVWACIVLAYAFIPALTPLADQLERR